jgi:hypothetical protein
VALFFCLFFLQLITKIHKKLDKNFLNQFQCYLGYIGVFMKFFSLSIILFFISTLTFAQDKDSNDLEEILNANIAELILNEGNDSNRGEVKDTSERISKLESLKEIYEDYQNCAKGEIFISKNNFGMFTTFAFSCNLSQDEIFSSEIIFKNEENGFEFHNYQTMVLTKREMNPMIFRSLFLDDSLSFVEPTNQVTPGIKALFNLAKVGIPVYLTLKYAKVITPTRADWQKHLIAGSIVSGVTVLSSQALITTYNNRHGSKLNYNQINLLASFSGLLSSFAAGVVKEARDKWTGKGTPDVKDAIYTGLGGSIVSVSVAIPIPSKHTKKKRL